jgi:PAS domain S-box-containing protein
MKDRAEEAAAQALPNEAARLFNSLVAQLIGFVYRCCDDEQWTMEYVSHGFQSLTGRSPDDLIGNRVISYNELIHADDRERVATYCGNSKDAGHRIWIEYRICHVDGTVHWVSERAVRVYDQLSSKWKW